jgi:hypothetical protein
VLELAKSYLYIWDEPGFDKIKERMDSLAFPVLQMHASIAV